VNTAAVKGEGVGGRVKREEVEWDSDADASFVMRDVHF
jgi:hypothetical protein